eukprot:CAMPEP_0206305522 /NCGR_PEP_ID=MMETSP0106_2-20121207/10306_1 /ASSEMBLY_ACC=CAM_ASM_000206 /TAXON_ID=81532 /ORGANISM="Acanthoeca-like sp., Strain 10tr" /LENGTH=76 /DNA_ID=CAMNT_0053736371 /DNA_START=193 /DNA_END=421 /DNA_ORIENTATION=+
MPGPQVLPVGGCGLLPPPVAAAFGEAEVNREQRGVVKPSPPHPPRRAASSSGADVANDASSSSASPREIATTAASS